MASISSNNLPSKWHLAKVNYPMHGMEPMEIDGVKCAKWKIFGARMMLSEEEN